jgi:type I restriction enzyme S subunit
VSAWETVTLDQVTANGSEGLRRGPFGGAVKKETFVPAGYKVYEQKHAIYGDFDVGSYYIGERHYRDLRSFAVEPGDLIVSCSGTLDRVAIVPPSAKPGIINQALLRIRPKSDLVFPRFFKMLLETPELQSRLFASAGGSAIKNVKPLDEIRIVKFKLPPLAEQWRIAELLDRAEASRANRRAALTQLDSLTQSLFLDLFGDAGENGRGWPVRAVAEYVAEFQGGKSIDSESGDNVITRNRVLKVSAVTGMKFLAHESKPVADSYEPPEEHFAKPGDLLFSRANTTELVGAVAYVESTPPNVLLPDKLWRFVWRDPAAIEPLFIWALFQTPALRREIGRRATGTSGSMKNISQEKVFGIRTILPPIKLQREFAGRVQAVEKLKTAQRASLAELDALFAALQHRAFRGEL